MPAVDHEEMFFILPPVVADFQTWAKPGFIFRSISKANWDNGGESAIAKVVLKIL